MPNLVSHSETGDDRYTVRSLAKGLELLHCFGHESPSLSLKELSERMGWSKATTYRFAFTLQQLGYLDHDQPLRRGAPARLLHVDGKGPARLPPVGGGS